MASTWNKDKHDIGLLRADSSKVGFMLAQKSGVKQYEVFRDEYLAQQRFTGVPGYDSLPPEKELAIRQDDWRSGFGKEVYDSSDPLRYFSSIGMDLRHKGMAIAGPKPTAITPLVITLADGGLEDWSSSSVLRWWTKSGAGSSTRNAGNRRTGNYCADLDNTAGFVTLHQDYPWDESLQGASITLTAYCKTSLANKALIRVDDGVDTTDSSYHTGDNTYQQLTVAHTLDAKATRLRLVLRFEISGSDTAQFDDVVLSGATVDKVVAFAEYNNELMIAQGFMLSKLSDVGSTLIHLYTFPQKITDIEAFTDGNFYIAQGSTAGKYYYLDSNLLEDCNDSWNESIDTDVTSSSDTSDKLFGTASVKLVVATGAGAGDILATEVITSTSLTGFHKITLHIKSSTSLDDGDLQLLLDDTADCASPIKLLNIPAVSADTWTSVSLYLGDASGLGSVISIGLKMVTDKGAFTVRLDEVRAESFTLSTLGDGYAEHFEAVKATLYKSVLPRELKTATNPANGGSWSGATNVDSPNYDILNLETDGNTIYIKKEDRGFYLDTSGNVQVLAEETRHLASATSTKAMTWAFGRLYTAWGTQSLLEYDGGTNTWRTPALFSNNLSDFVGEIQGLAADDFWVFAIVDNSSKIEVMAGNLETIGTTAWVWHPIAELTLTGCQTTFVSSVYQKRLWISSTSSSDSLYYYPLPIGYGDVVNDTNRSFLTSTYFITSWQHANFKGDNKSWIKLILTMGHSYDVDIYFEAHYQKLGDSSWTDIGDFKGSTSSMTETKYLPVDGSSNNPVSTMMRFKFVAKTDDTTKTPILLSYDARALLSPANRKIIQCVVRCVDVPTQKDGVTRDSMTASQISEALWEAADATWPVEFYDIDGNTKYVNFLPMREVVIKNEKGLNIERHFYLTLQEVALS